MAEVWLARSLLSTDDAPERCVLKTILPTLAGNPAFVRMFINEALLAARLVHPNIVRIFDLGEVERSYFIAMERVVGRTLREVQRRCRIGGSLPVWFVLRTAVSVCDALEYAHEQRDDAGKPLRLVHRDISPENVMVGYAGSVKVLDFGIALASIALNRPAQKAVRDKYAYVAPELLAGRPADRQSDVYALGVMLYELLTGRQPYGGKNEVETLRNIVGGVPDSPRQLAPWLDERLEKTILKALARDPAERFSSASALRDELATWLRDTGDHHGPRDLGIFVGSKFHDDPDIPGEVVEALAARQANATDAESHAPSVRAPSGANGEDIPPYDTFAISAPRSLADITGFNEWELIKDSGNVIRLRERRITGEAQAVTPAAIAAALDAAERAGKQADQRRQAAEQVAEVAEPWPPEDQWEPEKITKEVPLPVLEPVPESVLESVASPRDEPPRDEPPRDERPRDERPRDEPPSDEPSSEDQLSEDTVTGAPAPPASSPTEQQEDAGSLWSRATASPPPTGVSIFDIAAKSAPAASNGAASTDVFSSYRRIEAAVDAVVRAAPFDVQDGATQPEDSPSPFVRRAPATVARSIFEAADAQLAAQTAAGSSFVHSKRPDFPQRHSAESSWPIFKRPARPDTAETNADEVPSQVEIADEPEEDAAARAFDEGFNACKRGDLQDALLAWNRACELDPDNRTYRSNLKILRKRLEQS